MYKWAQLAEEFQNKWQIPNCLGSIDGKHIVHQVINFNLLNLIVLTCF